MESNKTAVIKQVLLGILIFFIGAGLVGCSGSESEDVLTDVRLVPDVFEIGKGDARLEYTLAHAVETSIIIYDSAGRIVVRLVESQRENKGFHLHRWNGQDAQGNALADGLYVVSVHAGDDQEEVIVKMVSH